MKYVKILISSLIIISLLLLCACGDPDKNDSNDKNDSKSTTTASDAEDPSGPDSKLLLPKSVSYPLEGVKTESVFTWTENTCTYSIADYTLEFVYDPATKTLDYSMTHKGTVESVDDFCKFDDEGRVVSIDFGQDVPLTFSYSGDKITALSCPASDDDVTYPREIFYDKQARKIALPPFAPNSEIISFNEYGDLLGTDEQILNTYTYDDNGNVLTITPYSSSSSIGVSYGTATLTESWQKVPLKLAQVFLCGYPMIICAANILCISLI